MSIFLCLSAVCASDVNETADTLSSDTGVDGGDNLQISDDDSLEETEDDVIAANASNVVSTSSKTSSASVYTKNSKFDIQILDEKGSGIANKQVKVNFNGASKNLTTNSKGHVYFKLNAKGTYKLSYSFASAGYAPVSGSKTITIVDNTKSKLTGYNYVAYVGIKNTYPVILTTGGVKLPNQKVKFRINGKYYSKTTDSNGKAKLTIDLPKGTYTVKYTFKGTTNAKAVTGYSKITVKKGSPTKLVLQESVTYKHKTSGPFTLKYYDAHGSVIPYKTVVFKINGKTYTNKTNKKGLVTFNIKQSRGIYKATARTYHTPYLKSTSKSFTIKVKSDSVKNNGFWLFGSDMKSVNLNTMAKYGVNQIFLNSYAIDHFGKSAVSTFAKDAGKLGINVNIWMQTFNDGSWISPVYSSGNYKYSLFNSIIDEAKEYAGIEGVDGIHFDYLRFPGTAYKYKNGVEAINYFTKKACDELHKLNSSIIVSAAIMPEPSSDKYYYGQDIPTITKYLDVIVPMIYKGNYNAGASWVKTTTNTFVKMSSGAQVWTGLQGYYSDSNVKKLPASTLTNDAVYAGLGGASGVIVFRYSLFNLINFDCL